MLYDLFWVIVRSLNCICQRFGTLCLYHLHRRRGKKKYLSAYEDGTRRVFRNVGIYNSDSWELPRIKHIIFIYIHHSLFISVMSEQFFVTA